MESELAARPRPKGRGYHEPDSHRYEEVAALRGIKAEERLREDLDEEDGPHHSHEDNEIIRER